MLGKLIKHEFRATRRIMLPLIGGVALLSVLAGLSIRGLDTIQNFGFLGVMYSLTLGAFFLALFAMGVVALVLMIQRFYRNLLRDEGYLTMTLPVSVDAQIWAKLIVSFVWFAVVTLLSAAAMLIMISIGTRMDFMSGLDFEELYEMLPEIKAFLGGGNIALFVIECLVLGFLGSCAVCLRCYSALAIGCSAANHKLLYSFLTFIGIGFAVSMIQNSFSFLVLPNMDLSFLESGADSVQASMRIFHFAMGAGTVLSLIYCAVFYFVTRWFLKNRLNLA